MSVTRPVPQQLIKYMNAATGAVVLETGRLRWSTPGTLNDPFDAQFDLQVDIDHQRAQEVALQRLWEAYSCEEAEPVGNVLGRAIRLLRERAPGIKQTEFIQVFNVAIQESLQRITNYLPRFHDEIRTHIAQSKILCLTAISDSSLMWAHYADGHRGIALCFRSASQVDSPWRMARPVEYQAEMPKLMDTNFFVEMIAGCVSIDKEAMIHRMIFTKSHEWQYEQEWRICSGAGRSPQAIFEDIPFHPLELSAVIIGERISDGDRERILELTRQLYPHASLLRTVRAEREFRLRIEELVQHY
jgi:Protein of unknown function (DUF2971)